MGSMPKVSHVNRLNKVLNPAKHNMPRGYLFGARKNQKTCYCPIAGYPIRGKSLMHTGSRNLPLKAHLT